MILTWLPLQALVLPLAFQGHGQTLPVQRSQAGPKFFVFEGMRLMLDQGRLFMASLSAGSCLQDFHQVCSAACTPGLPLVGLRRSVFHRLHC